MTKGKAFGLILSGFCAGAVNGLFGAGGGMVLVPLLAIWASIRDAEVFPTSLSIMLPVCTVSLGLYAVNNAIPWATALPYLIGSGLGGILAGIFGGRIRAKWLHRTLGIFILWGGIRYLW